MKARVILNPSANNWRAQKQIPQIEQALASSGIDYELCITERKKQATELAASAVEAGFDTVMAAGGDGTIHEVVNGLIGQSGSAATTPLGILPIGTGNDLSDMLNLSRDVEQAVQTIVSGRSRQIDIGRVTIDGKHHYFDNNCAVAMEPLITAEYNQLGRLSGVPRYVAAVIKGLFKLRPWPMKLEWDDGSYEGDILVGSVCNGPRTGSTFLMSPDAKVDDGLFDFVFVPKIPMRTVLS
ncbi:MAG: diacylglycerol/lipid kinase family protein, partial [Candidatus Promineifilaceae bacterium]